jgi:membrane-bound inhibitor of C-type lysozyme
MTSPHGLQQPHRKRLFAAALLGAIGLGLAAGTTALLPLRAEEGLRATYRCEGRFDAVDLTAFFFKANPAAVVLLEGLGARRLPQAIAASGARYSDGSTSFWIKGDRATWIRNGDISYRCRASGG